MPRGWLAARWRKLVGPRDDEALLATLDAPQVLRLHGVVESPNTLHAPTCGFACAAVRVALLQREPVTEDEPARRDERATQERYVTLVYACRGGELRVRLRQGTLVHIAAEHVWLSGPVDASSVPVTQTNLLPEFRNLPELDQPPHGADPAGPRVTRAPFSDAPDTKSSRCPGGWRILPAARPDARRAPRSAPPVRSAGRRRAPAAR